MKNNTQEFHAVEFMRTTRKYLTEKYQHDRNSFLKELDRTTQDFINSRKKRKNIKLKPANESIKQGLKEAVAGKTFSRKNIWK